MPTIQDITPHINRNSISRSITQNETEKGGPDIINFDDLDEYISNFEEKVVEEAEGLRSWKARRRRTIKRSKRKTRTKKRSTMKKYKNNKKRKDYKK
jgi:hypothetical protein